MNLIVLMIVLIPNLVFAEKKIAPKDMSILGKIDESTMNQEASVTTQTGPETAAKSKFSVTCKDTNGVEYKTGEVGYDACLNNLKGRSNFSKMNSGLNKKDAKDSSESKINFKIGE